MAVMVVPVTIPVPETVIPMPRPVASLTVTVDEPLTVVELTLVDEGVRVSVPAPLFTKVWLPASTPGPLKL